MGGRVAFRKSARKVYVGNLPSSASEKDVIDLFASSSVPCALPAQVDMKTGYAFVVSYRESSDCSERLPSTQPHAGAALVAGVDQQPRLTLCTAAAAESSRVVADVAPVLFLCVLCCVAVVLLLCVALRRCDGVG